MRRCPRSEDLHRTLAADEPLAPELAAHLPGCATCSRASAAVRRFDAQMDAALAGLVTDALPPSTVIAARMAPPATRRRPTSFTVASTLVAGAFVVFAAVGIVATLSSISNAMRSGSAGAPDASAPDLDRVDCYVGGSIVEVTVGRVGAAGSEDTVAYCFGVESPTGDREARLQCAQAAAAASAARRAQESEEPGATPAVDPPEANAMRSCTLVEESGATDTPIEADAPPFRSTQLDSWEEATEAVDWPILSPEWLPDGYELAALQGFSAEGSPDTTDWVSASYLRVGILLSVDQFKIADPDDADVVVTLPGYELGEVSAGRTTVKDLPAFWGSGLVETVGGSEVEVLELVWNDGKVGYRITARNEDLDTLQRIAESLTDR